MGSEAVIIYTDGACSGNPGPGGWGAVLIYGSHRRELRGGELSTTNNRMELLAAILALEALKKPASQVELHTDSQYMRQGITQWIHGWKRNGWKTAARKPVKNEDLWRRLDELRNLHEVDWRWVKGHAGHPENERADELARLGLAEAREGKAAKEEITANPPDEKAPALPRDEAFTLHPRLEADSHHVCHLGLCEVRLINDRRWPWLLLIPARAGLAEMGDLSRQDSHKLIDEIRLASRIMRQRFDPERINVASLGNMVPQLHIHIIARRQDDPAWPGPVWGHGDGPQPYASHELDKLISDLARRLSSRR